MRNFERIDAYRCSVERSETIQADKVVRVSFKDYKRIREYAKENKVTGPVAVRRLIEQGENNNE